MAAFGATLRESGVLDAVANGYTINITDHSNYDTNTDSGHLQSDFSEFRQITVENPDGTSHVFSTVNGDELITAPSVSVLPILSTYNYTTGDGVYRVCLYVLPTWRIDATYTSVGNMCVYYNDRMWRAMSPSTGTLPGTDATRWEEILSVEDLPNRYRFCERFAVFCDAIRCSMEYVRRTLCGLNVLHCTTNICDNKDFQKAAKLDMILNAIPHLVMVGDWDSITELINLSRQICCCYDQ